MNLQVEVWFEAAWHQKQTTVIQIFLVVLSKCDQINCLDTSPMFYKD